MRFRSPLLCSALGALVLAGCGSEDRALIPRADADQLSVLVADAGRASAAGECDAAQRVVREAELVLDGLPRRTDRELKRNVRTWLEHLDEEIAASCGAEEEPVETPTPAATETATPTPTPEQTAEPTPEPTSTPIPTPTVVPPAEGLPDEVEEPDDTGGVAPEDG